MIRYFVAIHILVSSSFFSRKETQFFFSLCVDRMSFFIVRCDFFSCGERKKEYERKEKKIIE